MIICITLKTKMRTLASSRFEAVCKSVIVYRRPQGCPRHRLAKSTRPAQNKKATYFRKSLCCGATEDLNCEAVEPIHYSAGRMPEQ